MNNMFLNGPFVPQREESHRDALRVTGTIPSDIRGTMYRVGSSPFYDPLAPEKYHWFDGDGMVHAIAIGDGTASVRNRYVATAGLKYEQGVGHAVYGSFMNGGVPAVLDGSRPMIKNPANTNVWQLNEDDLLVFCEGDAPHLLDTTTLETKGLFNFGGTQGPVTAHFKIDPTNGDIIFFGSMGTHVNFYHANANGELLATYPFSIDAPAFMHDFAATENYAVFARTPALVDFEGVLQGKPSTIWQPDLPTEFGLMKIATGEIRWYPVDQTFTITHFLNAFERDGKVVVDANCAPDFGAKIGERNPFSVATPWRWTIDLDTGAVSGHQVADVNSEFPRVDPRRAGREHRYGYYAATRTGQFCEDWLFDHLAKVDSATGKVEYRDGVDGLTSPGEPVFVPRVGSTAEDDGYVLCVWWNAEKDESEMLIHDARNFEGPPLARIHLGHRVPMGFHGNWAPAAQA